MPLVRLPEFPNIKSKRNEQQTCQNGKINIFLLILQLFSHSIYTQIEPQF